MDADVIVIGAGPVGGLAARQLARKGYSVLLMEEHKQVGHPVHCAGLIGITGLQGLGIHPHRDVIIARVRASEFHAPSGHTLVFDKGEPHAYVLHRDRLDQQIVREAEAAGATLHLESRVTQCQLGPSGVRLSVRQGGSTRQYNCQMVVNAEGIGARLARQNGLPGPKPAYILPALQYEVSNVSLPIDRVHLFFDAQLASHFFAWVIPLETHRARVGIARAGGSVRQALDTFLSRIPLLREARIEKRFGGLVNTGGAAKKTTMERFVTVGDAAGQTKATTGGGVVFGGGCAIIAAYYIHRALRDGQYHHRELMHHEWHWKRTLGAQLRRLALLRRFANCLTNTEMDQLFLELQRDHVRTLVETKGDIDQQGKLIAAALTSPPLIARILRLLISKIRYFPQIIFS